MATGRGKEVDSRFTCTICFEPYGGREAKILPCFHTFCLPCLAGLVARGETPQTSGLGDTAEEGRQCDSLTCPTCRTVIPLPPRGVTGFQRNFYLDSVSGEADSGAVACTVCEADQTAQFLCGQCHNHVCCQCRRSHDKCCQGSQLTPLTPPSPSSAAQSVAQSMIQSVAQSTAQSVAQSIVQSMTQSAAQSTAQSNAVMSSAQASPRNLNDLYQKVEDLAGQVTSLQSANTHLTQHVTLLSSAHSKLSTEHSALQREVTSLREKNGQASLQREVRALRDKQAIAHQDLAVLTAEKDKACAGLAKLQTDILSMQTDASLQQTDILRLKADHGQVAAKLSAIQTDTKALQGGEASVKKEVDQLKTDCGQLMADKATIQTKLSSLDQLTSTIQGMMSNLESRFATANTQVGFTAGLTQAVTTSKEKTLVCDDIETNEGGGYDDHTGVFTAPVTGTYCFLFTTSPDRDVKKVAMLVIAVDGEEKGVVYSEGMSWSTGHTVVKLTCGQKVWLRTLGGRQCTFGGEWCTCFSGMLLQAEV